MHRVDEPNATPEMRVALVDGERWWGGRVGDGTAMPFAVGGSADLRTHGENQASGLLVSNRGRVLWSHEPFSFVVHRDAVQVTGRAELGGSGNTLREAVRWAAEHVNRTPRALPDVRMFEPQWVTWIEMLYEPTQAKVLEYARQVLEHGFDPGVLIVDDNWNEDYGVWKFRSDRFPDPTSMVSELADMGFAVMLWVCPYVSPDGPNYLRLRDAGLLITDHSGEPVIRRWWNGYSAVLDLTNEAANEWFRAELDELRSIHGVAGFKFDGADPDMYDIDDVTAEPTSPAGQVHRYGQFAERFAFNELRAGWDLGGRGLAMRLSDANHSWDDKGVAKLVPNHLAQGLLGMPFGAPDMIGGGQYLDFDEDRIDPEVFVRHAQIAAFSPMMQFSAAPWRLLDAEHASAVAAAAELRSQYQSRIVELAHDWLVTGDPIMRPLSYEFPAGGHEDVTDTFMLGPDLLVAPVVERGAQHRSIDLPAGSWRDEKGTLHRGGQTIVVDVGLNSVPRFERC